MIIGYLVPEFPGQTHAFFWREIACLRRAGAQVDLISTKRPNTAIMCHDWTADALAGTTYLFPPGPGALGDILRGTLRAGLGGWRRAWAGSHGADAGADSGTAPKPPVSRLAGLAAIGARVAALARARGWDHLHVHSCADSAYVAMYANLLGGLPYSLTLHGPLTGYGPGQTQKWRHAAFATVITQASLKEVGATLGDDLPRRVEVAAMGVDLLSFQRTFPYGPWPGSGPLRLVSCGRLNPCKGHADLILAVDILRRRGLDVRLRIAGEDEQGGRGYRRDLEALIQQRGLAGSVELVGAIPEAGVRAELQAAHLFVLASLHEPLGVATMEAMAMEVPVIATATGGVAELVESGRSGLLVPPSDPALLAAAIDGLAHDPARAVRIAGEGRSTVVQRFGAERSAATLMRLIAAGKAAGGTYGVRARTDAPPEMHRQET